MKILYITSHYNPFDTSTGSGQRYNLLLRACTQLGKVDVVTFADDVQSNIPNVDVVYGKLCPKKIYGGRWNRFKRMLRPWSLYSFFEKDLQHSAIVDNIIQCNDYDLIVTRYIPYACESGLLRYADKLVVDVDDDPVDVQLTLSKNAHTWRAQLYYRILARLMAHAINAFLNRVYFAFFPNATKMRGKHVAYLPNVPYYEIEPLPLPKPNNHRIFFVGDLKYKPNVLGVEHFVQFIFPHIRNQVKDVEFYLAGRNYGAEWQQQIESIKGVHVLGFVQDLQKEYEKSNVCVVPVYSGAGTNIKVLEALRMNRACVVSDEATRGFLNIFEDGKDYLVAHNDNQFIEYVCLLLRNREKSVAVAQQGHESVNKNYSITAFNNIVKQALSNQ